MHETSPAAFISYSRVDSEFALRLAQDLKSAGASVWFDQIDIKPGLPWDNAIEAALESAPRMLIVLSPSSAISENVRDEISYALNQGKIIIPVLYMDCTIPLRLQRRQRIDFRSDYTHGLKTLLDELRVADPDPAVLQQAAEDEAKRRAAWQAREVEAERLRAEAENLRNEKAHAQEEDERKAHEDSQRKARDAERESMAAEREAMAAGLYSLREADSLRPKQSERTAVGQVAPKFLSSRKHALWIGVPVATIALTLLLALLIHHHYKSKPLEQLGSDPSTSQQSSASAAIPSDAAIITPTMPSATELSVAVPKRTAATSSSAAEIPSINPNWSATPTPKADPNAAEAEGYKLFQKKSYAAAVPFLRAACDSDNAEGCGILGLMYGEGQGVALDYGLAAISLKRACDGGYATGCFRLGILYDTGKGVTQDTHQSAALYQKACDGRVTNACFNVGVAYQFGLGVTQDYAQAEILLRKACTGGYVDGCYNLGTMYLGGLHDPKNYDQAFTLLRKACDGGRAEGCYNLALMYDKGINVTQDHAQAAALWQKACSSGIKVACDSLKSSHNDPVR